MTISRPARSRWPLAAATAVVGALIGLLLGLALGGGDEADPEQAARDTRSKLSQAAGLLEVAPVEYRQSVRAGAVVRPPEYRGARDAVVRSRDLYLEARPALAQLDPSRAQTIDHSYARLASLMAARAPASQIVRQAERLRALLGSG